MGDIEKIDGVYKKRKSINKYSRLVSFEEIR